MTKPHKMTDLMKTLWTKHEYKEHVTTTIEKIPHVLRAQSETCYTASLHVYMVP